MYLVRHGGKGDTQTAGAGAAGAGQNGGHQAEGQQGRDISQAGGEVQQLLKSLEACTTEPKPTTTAVLMMAMAEFSAE